MFQLLDQNRSLIDLNIKVIAADEKFKTRASLLKDMNKLGILNRTLHGLKKFQKNLRFLLNGRSYQDRTRFNSAVQ